MPIKSFRGKIADLTVDIVSLSTNNGSTGYRIKKLNIISAAPGNTDYEHVVKIYSIPQTTASVDGNIDFSDNTLLGVAYMKEIQSGSNPPTQVIVFDNMTFNQDIYVTHKDMATGEACNYYMELEQVKLDLNENTVATLKDIRNIESASQ